MGIYKEKCGIENLMLSYGHDEYLYNTSDNYTLTAGNAGNIIILLNNIVLGKVGKAGEVVDSLIINKNFNQ